MAAGILQTGYYVGFFLASVANDFIRATYGWRWMFIFGGLLALFISFIRMAPRNRDSGTSSSAANGKRPSMQAGVRNAVFGRLQEPHDRDVARASGVDHRAVGRFDVTCRRPSPRLRCARVILVLEAARTGGKSLRRRHRRGNPRDPGRTRSRLPTGAGRRPSWRATVARRSHFSSWVEDAESIGDALRR